ncbi:zinc metalloprotease [Streptomyces sp. NPDC051016]|uniref:zinc metalloprotease n=1 Tax=Streptomyces sp. NPDC051016 TaxID=3365638 RepID=UPI0037B1F7A2
MSVSKALRRGLALSGLLAAGLVVPAGAGAAPAHAACVTRPAANTAAIPGTAAVSRATAAAVQRDLRQREQTHPARKSKAPFTVGVVWNVFYDQATGEGNLSDAALQRQIDVVNQAFSPVGLSFRTYQVYRYGVSHAVLHGVAEGNQNEAYLKQTHKYNQQYLNLFTARPDDSRGWATFPWDYASRPGYDGVVLNSDTMPGGTRPDYDEGKTAVNLIGHWTGLWSTYQGGCSGEGDYVADTPAEASPAVGCPTGRDTCPAAGTDPIHNYMDDSTDHCRVQFTHGQLQRVIGTLAQYRGINL